MENVTAQRHDAAANGGASRGSNRFMRAATASGPAEHGCVETWPIQLVRLNEACALDSVFALTAVAGHTTTDPTRWKPLLPYLPALSQNVYFSLVSRTRNLHHRHVSILGQPPS